MSLCVLSPCWDSEQGALMVESAHRHGIHPELYDLGVVCDGHGGNIQYYDLLPILERKTDKHVLVTDCADVLWLAGEDEIMEKFASFNCGFVVSAEHDGCTGLPKTAEKLDLMRIEAGGYFGQINVGLWIGEREYALHVLKESYRLYKDKPEDPTYSYDSAWQWLSLMRAAGDGPRFELDMNCVLFQSMNHADTEFLFGRVMNSVVCSWPCLLHYNGDKTRGAYKEMAERLR